MEMTQDHLRQKIEEAFSDGNYPADERIVIGERFGDLKVVTAFKGKHWKEISSDVIFQLRFDLSRFTPEAFRFYLPAYLIESLRGENSGEIRQLVVWSLDPHEDDKHRHAEFLIKVEGFSAIQKTAIKAFIKYYIDTEPHRLSDDDKIEHFWEKYSI